MPHNPSYKPSKPSKPSTLPPAVFSVWNNGAAGYVVAMNPAEVPDDPLLFGDMLGAVVRHALQELNVPASERCAAVSRILAGLAQAAGESALYPLDAVDLG